VHDAMVGTLEVQVVECFQVKSTGGETTWGTVGNGPGLFAIFNEET